MMIAAAFFSGSRHGPNAISSQRATRRRWARVRKIA
jgi:hypothetical protein